jgi:hypothetical protein
MAVFPTPVPQVRSFSFARLGILAGILAVCLGAAVALGFYCHSLNSHYRDDQDRAAREKREQPNTEPRPETPAAALVSLSPEEQAAVNQAVIRGVRFLKTTQHPDGSWPSDSPFGCTALAGLTLLECGVPASDPNIQKAATYLRAAVPTLNTSRLTYELSLGVLFFDRLGDTRDRDRIKTMAIRLVAGQLATGGWSYVCPLLPPEAEKQLADALKEAQGKPGMRTPPLTVSGKWHPALANLPIIQDLTATKPERFRSFEGDNSNTQFGILALWVARRYDVAVERSAYLITERFRHSQLPDGQWGYMSNSIISPATTAAGLLGLAVGRGVALERDGTAPPLEPDPLVQKAFKYLGSIIPETGKIKKGMQAPLANLYVLWSLERVAVLYGVQRIDGKDWYAWARETLLTNQQEKGNWQGSPYPGTTPHHDTCFALLTLLQANLAKDLTTKLQLLGEKQAK